MLDLWTEAPLISNECAREHSWGGDYKNKEVEEGGENLATGLKRNWEELDEGEDEDEAGEKKDDVAMQPAPLSQLSSFMTRGTPEAGTYRQ